MKKIGLIAAVSLKNNMKSKASNIVFILVTLMIAAVLSLFFCILMLNPAIKAPVPDRTLLETCLSMIMYSTSLICVGMSLNVFAFQSMVKEKSHGNIESLIATPLNIKDIWIAKSLAVFIPGLILGEILTLAALLIINYIYFVPVTGFLYTHWIGLTSFLLVPLIYLCLSFLVFLIGLTGRAASANILLQIFLPVSISLMLNLMVRQIIDATSWPLALVNFGIAAVIVIIILVLLPRITRERIALSR